VKDLRDWDLLPDYGSYAQQTDLKARTCMGPLTEVSLERLTYTSCDVLTTVSYACRTPG
jgi:hypothetical protein